MFQPADFTRIRHEHPHSHVAGLLEQSHDLWDLNATEDMFQQAFENCGKLSTTKRLAASVYCQALLSATYDNPEGNRLLGCYWSRFADWSIGAALRQASAEPAIAKRLGPNHETGKLPSGLFVLGLGKLGGYDLNYSSDVDLVAFFDAKRFEVSAGQGRTDIATRVLKRMTQLLTATGKQVWRVDWRLRPDPSVTGIAMSSDAGLDFHFFQAAPWRRLAMMKARVVAGDHDAGNTFLRELTPFIWRKSLDFRAIDEIADIKTRIRNEHPAVENERGCDAPLEETMGFNVKLGTGGIREIEFVTNALQLVWGGREPCLRTTNTLDALNALAATHHLPSKGSAMLSGAYATLRGLENRLQLIADAHTHLLPSDPMDADLLGILCGEPDWQKSLKQTRITVNGIFNTQFKTVNGPAINDIFIPPLKGERAQEIVGAWKEGFRNYPIGQVTQTRLRPLLKVIAKLLESSSDPEAHVQRLHGFFSSLPPGGQYLLLLAENHDLASDILDPLARGGAMASLIDYSPHVVDLLIQRRGIALTTYAERQEILTHAATGHTDYEAKLVALRQSVNELLYLTYLQAWRKECTLAQARANISELAIQALDTASTMVAEIHSGTVPSIAAYGKLGMGELMPGSDLDIVYLAHGENSIALEDVSAAHNLAGRLTTVLSAEMKGGRIWEIDTRLRPSGASGAPTVRLESFRKHQLERAATWEHFALVFSRVVTGPPFAREAFAQVRHAVMTRNRNRQAFDNDCMAMLTLLRKHRISQSQAASIKLLPGGLMEAEYLIALAALRLAPENQHLTSLKYQELIREIAAVEPKFDDLPKIIHELMDFQFLERLNGADGQIAEQSASVREKIAIFLNAYLEDEFTGRKLPDFQQKPVVWQSGNA